MPKSTLSLLEQHLEDQKKAKERKEEARQADLSFPSLPFASRRKKKSKSSSKPKDEIRGTSGEGGEGAAGGSRRKTDAERRFEEMQRERVSPRPRLLPPSLRSFRGHLSRKETES